MEVLAVVLGAIVVFGVSFLLTSGLVALICWAFSLIFSWKLAVGIWAILLLVGSVFKTGGRK